MRNLSKMTNTIKGPIKIGAEGLTIADLVANGKVKLPFTAEGWVSDYNSDLVNNPDEGEDKKIKDKIKTPPLEEVKVGIIQKYTGKKKTKKV
jgi:hypothetical protein